MKVLFIGLFFVCAADPPPNTAFDDAKRFVASFKNVVNSPFSTSFLSKDKVTSELFEIGRKTITYADLAATLITVGLNQDDTAALIEVVQGVEDTIKVFQGQVSRALGEVKEIILTNTFYDKVTEPVRIFLQRIEYLVKTKRSEEVTKDVRYYCTLKNSELVMGLERFALFCNNASINFEAASILHQVVDSFKFSKYKLDPEEEFQFNSDYYTIYSFLDYDIEENRKKIESLLAAGEHQRMTSKMELLRKIVVDLNLDYKNNGNGMCLPLNIFVKARYNREAIENFMLIVKSSLHYIDFITKFCSRIIRPDDPSDQEIYINITEASFPVIIDWLTLWTDKTMNSTWPDIEMNRTHELIKEATEGEDIEEDSVVYGGIIDYVQLKMKKIGHRGYNRRYLMAREDTSSFPKTFYSVCKEGHCSSTKTNGAVCLVFRTDTSRNDLKRLRKFAQFSKEIGTKVITAMSELRDDNPSLAVSSLDFRHHLNLEDFRNHSSLAVIKHNRYLSGCRTYFNVSTTSIDGVPFLQMFDYHNDGGFTQWCVHFTFIFSV